MFKKIDQFWEQRDKYGVWRPKSSKMEVSDCFIKASVITDVLKSVLLCTDIKYVVIPFCTNIDV